MAKTKTDARSKIYTKKGDHGYTSLVTGHKVKKTHPRLESYGSVDELNSAIGLAASHLRASDEAKTRPVAEELLKIQQMLFTVGSHLACDDKAVSGKLPPFTSEAISFLEARIDAMDEKLPPLKNFVLPGGTLGAAYLHLARTVCRRAERHTVHLAETDELDERFVVFLNRLSDYLFVCARYCNFLFETDEILWKS